MHRCRWLLGEQLVECFGWSLPAEGLAGAAVELGGDCGEVVGGDPVQVTSRDTTVWCRPIPAPIARNVRRAARPREISSRSADVKRVTNPTSIEFTDRVVH